MSEYMALNFPNGGYETNYPLGPVSQDLIDAYGPYKAAQLYRPSRPSVDAMVKEKDRLIFYEFKIFQLRKGLGDLTVYMGLVDATPELTAYKAWPREFRLVVPWTPPWLLAAAKQQGIHVERFFPEWVRDYLEEYNLYWTKQGRMKREQRRRVLKEMGIG